MQWIGVNELREKFLKFFESKGHMRVDSFPLIPKEDHSLLLINSGMAPMKKWFLGQQTPPCTRVTTCQKCIRTPDIDRVGKTDRHGTFFEMLGNFSFGDYFKEETTKWAWEFVTEVLQMPKDKLYVTIFQDDDQTFDIWTKHRGVDASHITRLGADDNFWEIGAGPCGPCSELYFDRGEKHGCGKPNCGPGCDCDRFVEFWNLVFSEFDGNGKGHYAPMERPNIDTGMGLERLACILQGVDNLFEVDTIQDIMQHICRIAHVQYHQSAQTDVSLRVITDHIRSSVFLIADGVIPGNEGRGYVLRRLIRRAYRNGRQLGIVGEFLYQVADTVIAKNKQFYPELNENADYIKKILRAEEESFSLILMRGMNMLSETIDKLDAKMGEKLSGEQAFRLCDTYGFPFDLIKEIVSEKNLEIDEKEYQRLMEQQKERARAVTAEEITGWSENEIVLDDNQTEFVGYDCYECEASLLHLITSEGEQEQAGADDKLYLIFDRTPFYAESGGQIADRGVFSSGNNVANIIDCQKLKSGQFAHKAVVLAGSFKKGQNGTLSIDVPRRLSIARNHTAAHLLQKALRNVLGSHIHQAGQLVDDHRLRFDFNHFEAMTQKELMMVENEVNTQILAGLPVHVFETDIDTARQKGAVALFGEKYGEIVRVVDAEGYSKELCGGTHVNNTSKIGLFKILSESSASAGVRRIEATTGKGILQIIYDAHKLLLDSCTPLKVKNIKELPDHIKMVSQELKDAQKQIEQLNTRLATHTMKDVLKNSMREVAGLHVVSATFNGIDTKALRTMGDRMRDNNKDIVAVFASINEGTGKLVVSCGSIAVERGAHAGKIVQEIASLVGGKGGGRADFAMAGASEIFSIDEALMQLNSIVQKMVD